MPRYDPSAKPQYPDTPYTQCYYTFIGALRDLDVYAVTTPDVFWVILIAQNDFNWGTLNKEGRVELVYTNPALPLDQEIELLELLSTCDKVKPHAAWG